MFGKLAAMFVCTSLGMSLALAAQNPPTPPNLSAAEIVEKNVAARGGLQAWRRVETLSYSGKLAAGGNRRATVRAPMPDPQTTPEQLQQSVPRRPTEEAQLPFLIELARPRKQRIELQFNGQTAVQVFDGSKGWKLRPFLNRRVVEPFTEEEMDATSMQPDLDGPLVDYAAKGTKAEMDSMETVEGRPTYKLKLTLNNGKTLHVWIDAQSFLETKIEGVPRRLDGVYHPVEISYRDYRPVEGLEIPFLLETRVLPVAKTATGLRDTPVPVERITIDKVTVNPKLDSSLFSQAGIELAVNAKPR